MTPIIGFSGKSGSGKTTLMTAVVAELSKRGKKVGCLKHTRHQAGIDHPGKDTARYYEAGAQAVALLSPGQAGVYMRSDEDTPPAEIAARLFPEVDVVLVEGFHQAEMPRITVIRRGVNEDQPDPHGLIAVATDLDRDFGVPVYKLDDAAGIADLIEDYITRLGGKRDVRLFVNDRPVFIKPFIKDFFLNTISAMVDSLKDTGAARRISIFIKK